jgi:hypothetical protein
MAGVPTCDLGRFGIAAMMVMVVMGLGLGSGLGLVLVQVVILVQVEVGVEALFSPMCAYERTEETVKVEHSGAGIGSRVGATSSTRVDRSGTCGIRCFILFCFVLFCFVLFCFVFFSNAVQTCQGL